MSIDLAGISESDLDDHMLNVGDEMVVDAPFCGIAPEKEEPVSEPTPVSGASVGYTLVPIGCLRPHRDNNLLWEEEPIDDLIAAIQKSGHISPLVVMMNYDHEGDFDGTYTILGGHRRFRAACALGYTSLMCKAVRPGTSDLEALGILWSDNATCRVMTAADKLRAGLILFQRVPDGENKASVLANTCGMSYETAEKIMSAAAKVMRAMAENPQKAESIQNEAMEIARAHGISKVSSELARTSAGGRGRVRAPMEAPPPPVTYHKEEDYEAAFRGRQTSQAEPLEENLDLPEIRAAIQEAAGEAEDTLIPERTTEGSNDSKDEMLWRNFNCLIRSLPVEHQDVLSSLSAPVNLRELWRAIGYNPPDEVKDWKLSDLQTTDGYKPDTNLKRMGVKEEIVAQLLIGG